MNGGLAKFGRYLLAGASAIGLVAFGLPEAKAQNMQEIQAQINQMQATIKALQKQVEDAKAQAAVGADDCRHREGQRSRPQGQVEGRAAIVQRRWQVLDESPRAS